MVEIPLTQGQVALVDECDAERVSAFKWCAERHEDIRTYYACRYCNPKKIYMHRFVIDAGRGQLVDHRNHDGLDNRRENLRLCTASANSANSRKRRGRTSSRFKGVSWIRRRKRWRSEICVNGKSIDLGYGFRSEEEAALAYDRAALQHFGAFALTNAQLFGGIAS